MATNYFLPFAAGAGANALSDAQYQAALGSGGAYAAGVVTGQASSQQANKTWRQSTALSAALGQIIVNQINADASDSQTTATLAQNFSYAIQTLGSVQPFNSTFASQINGYPKNAIVSDANTTGLFWASTTDSNTTTPGASGASWLAIVADSTLLQWSLITSSTTLTVPSWARGFEIQMIAGGGAGAYCYAGTNTQVSGAGGGAGGFAWGAYFPGAGTSISLAIGAPGGNSSASWGGNANIVCYGGSDAGWPTNWSSPGGDGGAAAGGNILNITGGRGNDGMAGTTTGGNVAFNIGARGSSSWFGEGGRAGQGGGAAATGYGAGGGGAYDLNATATTYKGGVGTQGCALIRWLP